MPSGAWRRLSRRGRVNALQFVCNNSTVVEYRGTVLVVEDDGDQRAVVRDMLARNGFVVVEVPAGRQVADRIAEVGPDVVLLDLGLPDVSGLDVLSQLAAAGRVPVIVLTGRSGEADRVVGFDLGADDYVVKPVSARELAARVGAVIRRRQRVLPAPVMTYGDLTIDASAREVKVGARAVDLTPREFELLSFLARSPRQVFSREQLLEHVWGTATGWQDPATVAEHVYRVRRKLDPADRGHWIQTIYGVGYRFSPDRG